MYNKRGGMTVWLIFLILSTLVMGFLLRSGGRRAGRRHRPGGSTSS